MKYMTKREQKLTHALEQACSRLERAALLLEDSEHSRKVDRVLNSASLRQVLRECRTNRIVVAKFEYSTLTKVDIEYRVRVELLNDDLPLGWYSFTAIECRNSKDAWNEVERVSDTLERHKIDFEIVDSTGENN